MSRPFRKRCIGFWPKITYFKPAGIPRKILEEIELTGDEIESIRLKDLEGLDQIDVATKMKISRPTVVRILKSARKKIADTLINGKAIRFKKGNNIVLDRCNYNRQRRCGRTFKKLEIKH